jgi:hypothetical protein
MNPMLEEHARASPPATKANVMIVSAIAIAIVCFSIFYISFITAFVIKP